jgi:hypothetical protein
MCIVERFKTFQEDDCGWWEWQNKVIYWRRGLSARVAVTSFDCTILFSSATLAFFQFKSLQVGGGHIRWLLLLNRGGCPYPFLCGMPGRAISRTHHRELRSWPISHFYDHLFYYNPISWLPSRSAMCTPSIRVSPTHQAAVAVGRSNQRLIYLWMQHTPFLAYVKAPNSKVDALTISSSVRKPGLVDSIFLSFAIRCHSSSALSPTRYQSLSCQYCGRRHCRLHLGAISRLCHPKLVPARMVLIWPFIS